MAPGKYINISAPQITPAGASETKVSVSFVCAASERSMWFSVANEYASSLVTERSDAFLVALLSWAMRYGFNLRFAAPLSSKLYFSVTRFVIPTFLRIHPWKQQIEIEAPLTDEILAGSGECATGMSCGVDSLATLAEYTHGGGADVPPEYELSCLAFFNVGAHGSGMKSSADTIERVYRERLEWSRGCAQSAGLPLVVVNSNLMDYIREDSFLHNVTFCNCAAVLVLQKLFKTYYISSSMEIDRLKISEYIEYFEPLLIAWLGTESTTFFMAGLDQNRVVKTAAIIDFPLAHKFLNVCVVESRNCSRCHKCLRTLFTLDIFDSLPLFEDVFDLDYYMSNRARLWAELAAKHGLKWERMIEVWEAAKQFNFTFPRGYKLWRMLYLIKYMPGRVWKWIEKLFQTPPPKGDGDKKLKRTFP